MFLLQTPVIAELRSIRMQLDVDVRLAAAAGGAARYFADAAGLGHDAVSHLQMAVIAACEEAFHEVSGDQATLDVTLVWLVDRIEVSVSHQGAAPLSTSRDQGPNAAEADILEGVDDVQHETRDGIVVTRLTKFIKQGAASR
jgi:hypothetical protein